MQIPQLGIDCSCDFGAVSHVCPCPACSCPRRQTIHGNKRQVSLFENGSVQFAITRGRQTKIYFAGSFLFALLGKSARLLDRGGISEIAFIVIIPAGRLNAEIGARRILFDPP